MRLEKKDLIRKIKSIIYSREGDKISPKDLWDTIQKVSNGDRAEDLFLTIMEEFGGAKNEE